MRNTQTPIGASLKSLPSRPEVLKSYVVVYKAQSVPMHSLPSAGKQSQLCLPAKP